MREEITQVTPPPLPPHTHNPPHTLNPKPPPPITHLTGALTYFEPTPYSCLTMGVDWESGSTPIPLGSLVTLIPPEATDRLNMDSHLYFEFLPISLHWFWTTTPGDNDLWDNYPWDNDPWDNCSGDNYPWDNYPWDNYPWDNYPWDNDPWDNCSGDNYPLDNYPGDNYPGDNYPGDNYPWGQLPWGQLHLGQLPLGQ